MKEKFNYSNEMQIPRLDKIVVNMGIGEAVANSKASHTRASRGREAGFRLPDREVAGGLLASCGEGTQRRFLLGTEILGTPVNGRRPGRSALVLRTCRCLARSGIGARTCRRPRVW